MAKHSRKKILLFEKNIRENNARVSKKKDRTQNDPVSEECASWQVETRNRIYKRASFHFQFPQTQQKTQRTKSFFS